VHCLGEPLPFKCETRMFAIWSSVYYIHFVSCGLLMPSNSALLVLYVTMKQGEA
jgi:hypothetical protein